MPLKQVFGGLMRSIEISNNKNIFNLLCRIIFLSLSVTSLIGLVGFFAFDWFQNPPSVESFGDVKIYSNYAGVGAVKIRIGLALLLATILIWLPNLVSNKIKLIPFAWIFVEYILWAIGSYQIYSTSENTFSYKGVFFLYNATWWDIIILFLVLTGGVCLLLKPTPIRK
jgi:hypothetical protein